VFLSARRLLCSVFVTMVGVLVLASAPALAAPLEAPELTVESVTASSATLHGVLNPLKASEAGTYEFLYKQGKAGCAGGTAVPVPAGLMSGAEHEEPFEGISGLTQGTEYTVCLRAVNTTVVPNEEATSAARTFTTAIPPETPTVVSPVNAVTATSATLEGVLNPNAVGDPGSYEFLYRRSPVQCEGGEVSSGSALGDEKEAKEAELTGLQPGSSYTFCLRARNEAGEEATSAPVSFTTPPVVPTIESESESATNVSATGATLDAEIDPGGTVTYRVEYGTSTSYEASLPVPEGKATGVSAVAVEEHPQGLLPSTTYHYRFVASNAAAQQGVYGRDQTFTTQTVGGALTLPDGRQWEMVSPPDKHGSGLEAITENGGLIQAAADGGALAYIANGPTEVEPAGSNSPEYQQILAKRGPHGWVSQDIAIARHEATRLATVSYSEYRMFSPDLSTAVVEPIPGTVLAPGTKHMVDLRNDESGAYLSLVPEAFGAESQTEPVFQGATPDLSHIVVRNEALVLYEWVAGRLRPVSVLPGGTEPVEESRLGNADSYDQGNFRHAISNNGERIIWETGIGDNKSKENHLYLRDMGTEETIEIGSEGAIFEDANAEGTRIFFSGQECEVKLNQSGKLECPVVLQDGHVLSVSEDGSYVYFVSGNVLSNIENADKETAQAGEDNLYVAHYDSQSETWEEAKLIAVLSSEDAPDWGSPEREIVFLSEMTSRASPDGQYLAFMSDRSLTGYDNVDANPAAHGARDEEVYLYDAQSGRVVCASCDPTGARPAGVFDTGREPGLLVNRKFVELWSDRWLAGSIPGWTSVREYVASYQSRYLSDSGRLFFDSADALVPQDTNGVEDVYEYEPAGLGSCDGASGTFSERSGGCVGLISSGSSGEESAFLDASESDDDVFFLTVAQLVPQDVDTAFDVYDAHVCSAASPCVAGAVPSPPCATTDSCRAEPTLQPAIFGSPPSATFNGAGNVTPASVVVKAKPKGKPAKCKQGFVRKKDKCVRKPRVKSKRLAVKSARGRK
jgi:hypothetical protein